VNAARGLVALMLVVSIVAAFSTGEVHSQRTRTYTTAYTTTLVTADFKTTLQESPCRRHPSESNQCVRLELRRRIMRGNRSLSYVLALAMQYCEGVRAYGLQIEA